MNTCFHNCMCRTHHCTTYYIDIHESGHMDTTDANGTIQSPYNNIVKYLGRSASYVPLCCHSYLMVKLHSSHVQTNFPTHLKLTGTTHSSQNSLSHLQRHGVGIHQNNIKQMPCNPGKWELLKKT
jgi:hypothetical protein